MKCPLLLALLSFYSTISAQHIVVMDASSGAAYLSEDAVDGFFHEIQPLDIAIQLQDETILDLDREEAVSAYRASYKDEVTAWSEEEAQELIDLFDTLCARVADINPILLPDTIYLIALSGGHYGEQAFYTRKDGIAIPRSRLTHMPREAFSYVMYHELFHILSRRHDLLRQQLYDLVGYAPVEDEVTLHPSIQSRLLLNPDGVNVRYAIDLQTDTATESLERFIPVIYSTADRLDPRRTSFFSYLDFKLLQIIETPGGWQTVDLEAMRSMPVEVIMPAYFGRIGTNTQYIIHPDEILADNFMYLFRPSEANKELDLVLLDSVRELLSRYK